MQHIQYQSHIQYTIYTYNIITIYILQYTIYTYNLQSTIYQSYIYLEKKIKKTKKQKTKVYLYLIVDTMELYNDERRTVGGGTQW